MSATEQTIIDLQTELDVIAQTIHDTQINLAETMEAIDEAQNLAETKKAEFLSVALNSRFEINQKLMYTNEDQRKVKVIELQNADADFIALESAKTTLAATQAGLKAEIEKQRNLHKSKLLVLQYYANLA